MSYIFKAALLNSGELVGFRFEDEADSNFVADVPLKTMENITRDTFSLDDYMDKFMSYGAQGVCYTLDKVVYLEFHDTVEKATIDVDGNLNAKENRLPIKTQNAILKVFSPLPDETKMALINLNWLIYNTEFFDRFQVANVDGLSFKDGAPSISIRSHFSQKLQDTLQKEIDAFIDELQIKGVTVSIVVDDAKAKKMDQCSFELSTNLNDLDFGTMSVSGYQMQLLKSGRAIISQNGNSVAMDNHGISFCQPSEMDLYDQPDVDVTVVPDLDPYQNKPAYSFLRFYMDLADDTLNLLSGMKDAPSKLFSVANWYVAPDLKVDGEILDIIRTDDGQLLPKVELLNDKEARVTLRVPVDYTQLPVDVEEIQESIIENFESNVYDLVAHPKLKDFKMLIASGTATPVGDDAIDFSTVLMQK